MEINKSGINLFVTDSMDSPLLVMKQFDVGITDWGHISSAVCMINPAGTVRHRSSLCIDGLGSIAVDSDYGKSSCRGRLISAETPKTNTLRYSA